MWTRALRLATPLPFLLFLASVFPQDAIAEANTMSIQAAAAQAVVTPAIGSFIAGDAKNRRFTGIHDDLYAKAALLDDGDTALALVAIDCIGLTYPDIEKIRHEGARLAANPRLTPDRIVVGSTHTHCGPDVVGIWGPEDTVTGRDPEYIKRLIATAAGQIQEAAANLRPATLQYAQTTAGEDWVVNDCEPALLDRTLVALQAQDTEGTSIFTLTNFACHPTILDAVVDEVSADYLYGFYKGVGERLGGVNLFFQGSIGAWIQPNKQTRDFDTIDTLGRGVAARMLEALARPTAIATPRLRHVANKLHLEVANPGWKLMAAIGLVDREIDDTVETEVSWFAIGPVQYATHPGETSPQHGLDTKAMMPGDGPKCVLGLTQDALGYILKPEYFADNTPYPFAEYLTSMSLGPKTAPDMLAALRAIIPAK